MNAAKKGSVQALRIFAGDFKTVVSYIVCGAIVWYAWTWPAVG